MATSSFRNSVIGHTPWEVSFDSDDLNGSPAQAHASQHTPSSTITTNTDDDDGAWDETPFEAGQTLSLNLTSRDKGSLTTLVTSSLLPTHTHLDLHASLHALGRDGSKALLVILDTEASRWTSVRAEGDSQSGSSGGKKRRRDSFVGKILRPFDPLPSLLTHLSTYPRLTTLQLHSHIFLPSHLPLFAPLLSHLTTLSLTSSHFTHRATLPALLSLPTPHLTRLSLAGSSYPDGSEGDVLDALLPLLASGLRQMDLSGMSPSVVPTRAASHRLLEGVERSETVIGLRLAKEDRAREDDLWEKMRGVMRENGRREREGGW